LVSLPVVNENEDLSIDCSVTGTPTPDLKCELLSYKGAVQKTIPQRSGGGALGENGSYVTLVLLVISLLYVLLVLMLLQLYFDQDGSMTTNCLCIFLKTFFF